MGPGVREVTWTELRGGRDSEKAAVLIDFSSDYWLE